MITATGVKGMAIAGAWGFAAALGGHGITNSNAVNVLKPGA
jgi:hypothetical protein